MVKTAQDWGWSPTAVVRGAKNPHKHHRMDYAVATACGVLERERCQRCGVAAWHAYSTDNSITFHDEEVTCYGCAHKEKVEKDKTLDPGTSVVVQPVPEEGFDKLPGRNEFFERLAAEQSAKEAAKEKPVV